MSVIWTHGAEGSGQFRSLLIYNCKSFTFPHTLIIQLFVIYLQNPTDSSAFLQSPFARMAELVDALDSKSNVLKKTCRFEPGFGHKKRWGWRPSSLFVPIGTFMVGGETEDWLYFVISTVQADREVTLAKVKSEESLEASSPQRLIFSRRRCFIPAAVHSLTLSEN